MGNGFTHYGDVVKKCTGLRVGVFFVADWNLQSEDVMNRSIDVRVHEK